MTSMLQRIAAAAACALLLVCPASAQLIGSGHVMGNGTASPAAPTDTQLLQIMRQSGSGITLSGNAAELGTVNGALTNGHCISIDSSGNLIDAGGACGTGSGSGTVNAGVKGQMAAYAASGPAVVGVPTNCTPIETFGGAGNNSTNNSTAFNAEVASFGANGGCVGFGPGTYLFSSAVSITPPTGASPPTAGSVPYHISIRGSGPLATSLLWPSGNGISFRQSTTVQTIDAEDFSCVTGASGTSTCVTLSSTICLFGTNLSQNYFRNIDFRGDDFGISHYWASGINDTGMSGTNYESDAFLGSGSSGNGITISGNPSVCASSGFAIWHNVDKSQFFNLSAGIQMGQDTQGLTVEQGNFQAGAVGIFVASGLPSTGLAQFSVHNSSFNTGSTAIEIDSPVSGSNYVGNTFDVATNQLGINLSSSGANNSFNTIIGNSFQGASTTGTEAVSTAGTYTTIEGNSFGGLEVGINGGSGAGVMISGNVFRGVTIPTSGGTLTGVTCTGTPSGSFASSNGVQTHC